MNMTKSLPFPLSAKQLQHIVQTYPTPFYLYDEQGIRQSARALLHAFAWSPGFTNYFAVKATPNPHIMAVLAEEGCGMDCSSLAELVLSEHGGVVGERDHVYIEQHTGD